MGKIADVRAGLATAMGTIAGLSTEAYVRDIADVPVAMVGGPDPLEYDKTFGRGHDDYTFPVMVFAARVSDEDSQTQLDAYLDPFGASSIKAAIEADSTLGGVVDDLRVTGAREYGPQDINGVMYLGAVLLVEVMASGKA
jgi:hypothetical protein